ncbi:MAG: conjugal transfer protein TraX [Lachnospiraceae bacterium]|nr:conjugal transfer protein TraX [Lachnospiraceae bacterium]
MSTENKLEKIRCLSGSTLKIAACLFMFIDHMTAMIRHRFGGPIATLDYRTIRRFNFFYKLGRGVGRLAFPIFCFLLVEGFRHTRNPKRYLTLLIIGALISEHAFNLLHSGQNFDGDAQNVMFTLAISLVVIAAIKLLKETPGLSNALLSVGIMAAIGAGAITAWLLKTDYSYKGVFSIALIYLLSYDRLLSCLGGAISFAWENWAPAAFIPLLLYNGKRGLKIKYFFYLFYPLHIYLIYYVVYFILPKTFGV